MKMKRMMMMKKKPLRKFIDFTYKFNSLFPHHWLPPHPPSGFQPDLLRGLFFIGLCYIEWELELKCCNWFEILLLRKEKI